MINFLSNWIEQIAISVIIVSVFELLLPNGNLKKYIKVILGIYVIFCIISPFVNSSALYDLGEIDLEDYVENVSKSETTINQESMDNRLQELYIEQLKENIRKKVEEEGYQMDKCNIDADLNTTSDNPGIHSIHLVLNQNKKIGNIEKVEIGTKDTVQETNNEEINRLKQNLADDYEVSQDVIKITLK